MRIISITAGAGGMYCGSCIRDNTLAKSLRQLGHDVLLVPLYTPPRTDEPSVSEHRVFFGGISVYLEQYSGLFRGTPWLLDRLWESPWLLRAVSQRGVQTQPEQLGELTVSVLEGRHGHQRKEFDKLVHWLRSEPRPDVIDISNSMLISLAPALKEAIGCGICCTLQGEDIFLDHLDEPYRSRALALIREHARSVDRFVAVSDYYAGHMARYLHIPGAKLDVVPLGINADGYPEAARDESRPFTIGYLGRIAPEKGIHLLCDAYHRLRERDDLEGCRLELAGYLGPEHQAYLEGIVRQVREWGLEDEIHYRGVLELDDKVAFPAAPRRVRRAGDVRRSEGTVPGRGDGVRCAGSCGETRHLRGADRAHGRGSARSAGRRRGADVGAAAAAHRPWASPRAGFARRGGGAGAVHRGGHGATGCRRVPGESVV